MNKVLHVITGLGPGGAESMLVKLLQKMDSDSFNNQVVILGSDLTRANELAEKGIIVFSLNLSKNLTSLIRGVLRFNKIVEEFNPDIIQTWLYHSDFFTSIALFFSKYRSRVLWNIRNSDLSDKSSGIRILLFFLVGLSRTIPTIVTNSFAGMSYHSSIGYKPKSWEIIPNGFDPESIYPSAELRTQFRKSLDIDPSEFLIGNISRFDPNKDYETFFKSISLVVTEIGKIRILIAGKGCSFENKVFADLVKKYNLDHVTIALGETNRVNEILNCLDLLLFPSINEGFPNVLGEAMLCNTPYVATNCGDIEILVGDKLFLCDVGDAKCLSQKIMKRYLNRETRPLDSRKRILDQFTIENISKKYSHLYQNFTLKSFSP